MKAQQMFQQGREKISSNHNSPALPPVGILKIFRRLFVYLFEGF